MSGKNWANGHGDDMASDGSVRGILKKDSPVENSEPAGHLANKHLQWDEENLAETEREKSSTMKITEPKTPFVHNIKGGTSDDEHEEGGVKAIPGLHLGSDSEGSSAYFSSSAEWESSEELDPTLTAEERTLRKEKFRRMRKAHYQMREGIRKGKELVKSESELSDGDDD